MRPVADGLLPPRYRDPERLAGGGMGVVYRALDGLLGRPVAVKLLAEPLLADEDARRRLLREAQAAARLSGEPHTLTIHDVGEWRGTPFIVMEYLAGGSLDQLLRREGAQTLEQTLAWLAQAGASLDHAHARGVVHRDVKPANLLLDEHGGLHVADFGIASAAGLEALTQTGAVLGTAGYLAPEQAAGKRVTPASDRYALAVVAYELLTGERPFARDSLAAEAAAHINEPVPPASARNAALPRGIDSVLERALAKAPEARYASCAELVDALRSAESSAAPTRLLAAPIGAAPARRRLPRLLLLGMLIPAGAAAAALLAGGHGHAAALTTTLTVTTQSSTRTGTGPAQTVSATTGDGAPTAQIQQAEALMGAGRYGDALPLLERAAGALRGTATAAEARADADLAATLVQLGRCDEAIALLERAQQLQGPQPQTTELLAVCTGPPGHRPGHGHGNGHGDGDKNGKGKGD